MLLGCFANPVHERHTRAQAAHKQDDYVFHGSALPPRLHPATSLRATPDVTAATHMPEVTGWDSTDVELKRRLAEWWGAAGSQANDACSAGEALGDDGVGQSAGVANHRNSVRRGLVCLCPRTSGTLATLLTRSATSCGRVDTAIASEMRGGLPEPYHAPTAVIVRELRADGKSRIRQQNRQHNLQFVQP